jgi:hypothetical protein
MNDYVQAHIVVNKRTCQIPLLVALLGRETVILGYPWLRQENPDINWEKQMLHWRREKPFIINQIRSKVKPFEEIYNTELVISLIQAKITDEAREEWMKTRMSHSQLFAIEDKKKKKCSKEEIVPKVLQVSEYHVLRTRSWKVTTKNQI